MVHCFIADLIHCIIDSLNPLIHWFTNSLIHWFIDSFTDSLVDFFHCIDSWTHRLTNSLVLWFTVLSVHWCIVSLIHWFIDSLVHSFIDSLVNWLIGSSGPLCMDSFMSFHSHRNYQFQIRWCTSQLQQLLLRSAKTSPEAIDSSEPFHFFETSAQARAGHYLVVWYMVYGICMYYIIYRCVYIYIHKYMCVCTILYIHVCVCLRIYVYRVLPYILCIYCLADALASLLQLPQRYCCFHVCALWEVHMHTSNPAEWVMRRAESPQNLSELHERHIIFATHEERVGGNLLPS